MNLKERSFELKFEDPVFGASEELPPFLERDFSYLGYLCGMIQGAFKSVIGLLFSSKLS